MPKEDCEMCEGTGKFWLGRWDNMSEEICNCVTEDKLADEADNRIKEYGTMQTV